MNREVKKRSVPVKNQSSTRMKAFKIAVKIYVLCAAETEELKQT